MNAGQYLVALSGLSGVSAGQHLMAITAGTGTGATIFVDRLTLCAETPTMTLVRKSRADVQQPAAQSVSRPGKKRIKRLDVRLVQDQMWIVQRTETTATAIGNKNKVVSTSNRFVGVIG